ncbi:MAG: AI-2E family transporter [Saprospiraceae bacterium]
MRLQRSTYIVVLLIAITYILYISQSYLVPLVLAVLIWDIIRGLRDFFTRIKVVKDYAPIWLLNTLSFGAIFLVLSVLSNMIASGITQFSTKLPLYQKNIYKINEVVLAKYNYNLIEQLEKYFGTFDFTVLIQPIFNGLSVVLADGFMITLYCIFLLLEESIFRDKFRSLFDKEERFLKANEVVRQIDILFTEYLSLKTIVSLITGFCSYLVLIFLEVDAPVLWGILIFLLNYIPSIGSLIATAFPTIVAMLQTGDIMSGVWVLVAVGIIQVIVGNFVEPKVMGNSLNISPFVVIVALVVWGAIWGIIGMLLSVPITVIMILIMAQFDSTRGIAIMLSESGKVQTIEQLDVN